MKLESKTIRLRLVDEDDAEFILSLRLDESYNQFLSKVKPSLEAQKSWITSYKEDESNGLQFYFIIETIEGKPCGTVRVYDLQKDSFCWGSWILNESKPRYAAIESAFLVYKFGFSELGFKKSHFEVKRGNEGVLSFHRRMGATQTGDDSDNIYFIITEEEVNKSRLLLKDKVE